MNAEFDPRGYFYVVRVTAAAVAAVTLQIYDPAWVESGDACDVGPYERRRPTPRPDSSRSGTT